MSYTHLERIKQKINEDLEKVFNQHFLGKQNNEDMRDLVCKQVNDYLSNMKALGRLESGVHAVVAEGIHPDIVEIEFRDKFGMAIHNIEDYIL